MDNLKEDLLRITGCVPAPFCSQIIIHFKDTSVLENIYQILQSSTGSTFSARFNRIVHREDILAGIEEQDRKLDTSITSFQVGRRIFANRLHTNAVSVPTAQIIYCSANNQHTTSDSEGASILFFLCDRCSLNFVQRLSRPRRRFVRAARTNYGRGRRSCLVAITRSRTL